MKSLFDLPQEEFEKEIDKILASPSGAKCLLCGYALTNADEINYDESVECCEEHGFIILCPNHWRWFWDNEKTIGKGCIVRFKKEGGEVKG